MPKLYQFPSVDDRKRVHNLIRTYATGGITRNTMMRRIAAIIEAYRVSRFPVFGYSVRILSYFGDLPIISIEGAKVSDSCPVCGSGTDAARYLRTEKENFDLPYDLVSVTCLECGCVYQTPAWNGRGEMSVRP